MKDREQLAESAEYRNQNQVQTPPVVPDHAPRDYYDVTKIECTPDVCSHPLPEGAELITVHDPTTPTGGHIYKRTELKTKHMQSVQFRPRVGSNLSSNVELGGYKFKVVSIRVNTMNNSVFVSLLIHEPITKTTGVVSLRRIMENGEFSYSRHCFNLLVNPADFEKGDDEEVDVHFVSIESITVDPVSGLWNDLRIAIDAVTAPVSVFKRRGRRPVRTYVPVPRPFAGGRSFHAIKPFRPNMIPHQVYSGHFQPQLQHPHYHPHAQHTHHHAHQGRTNRRYVPRNQEQNMNQTQMESKNQAQDHNTNRYVRAARAHNNASRSEKETSE